MKSLNRNKKKSQSSLLFQPPIFSNPINIQKPCKPLRTGTIRCQPPKYMRWGPRLLEQGSEICALATVIVMKYMRKIYAKNGYQVHGLVGCDAV
jgi:hypothetical protein